MKVLVTGGTGTVGWAILSHGTPLADFEYTFHRNDTTHPSADGHRLDIRNPDTVAALVADIDPDVIIHSAAMTDVDGCEDNPAEAHAVNVEGTKHILAAAANVESHLVFLSTSFVFDGTKQPHERVDVRNPVNVYGQTKAEAEKRVAASSVPTTIVRTDQPYGWTEPWQNATMVEWVLEELSGDGPVAVFDDWYNVPTFLPDLAEAVVELSLSPQSGIYHAVGPDYVNRYEWAYKIAEEFGYDSSVITPSSSEETAIPASRPSVYLRNTALEADTAATFSTLDSGLSQMADDQP